MSEITNNGLTRYSTGCFMLFSFYAVPTCQQWASKG